MGTSMDADVDKYSQKNCEQLLSCINYHVAVLGARSFKLVKMAADIKTLHKVGYML